MTLNITNYFCGFVSLPIIRLLILYAQTDLLFICTVLQMLLHGIFLIFYMFIHDIHAPVRDVVSALLMFGSIISVTDFSLAKESFMKIGEFSSRFL